MADEALTRALVAELAKKTDVSWVRVPGERRTHPVWHTWHDDTLCLVSGGDEQPLPDLGDGDRVEVLMRSRDNGGRLLTWVGEVSVVRPDDEAWDAVTAALVADRLNLDDLSTAAAEWAERSVVRRVRPTGEVVEEPGALSDDAHRHAPLPTPATTRGRLPRVLHRRVKRQPPLS
ncbi:MAG: hypothetical protein HOQ22_10440 [Nocardioidaceae bacterium]|nr:hypothetical protein [Nocardioidaceae bacterium]NUS51444.1 hypothetical protein [Nocardioidaceae bacterium]